MIVQLLGWQLRYYGGKSSLQQGTGCGDIYSSFHTGRQYILKLYRGMVVCSFFTRATTYCVLKCRSIQNNGAAENV
jgi:hypothetical protein